MLKKTTQYNSEIETVTKSNKSWMKMLLRNEEKKTIFWSARMRYKHTHSDEHRTQTGYENWNDDKPSSQPCTIIFFVFFFPESFPIELIFSTFKRNSTCASMGKMVSCVHEKSTNRQSNGNGKPFYFLKVLTGFEALWCWIFVTVYFIQFFGYCVYAVRALVCLQPWLCWVWFFLFIYDALHHWM